MFGEGGEGQGQNGRRPFINPGIPTTRRQASAEVLLGFSEFCFRSVSLVRGRGGGSCLFLLLMSLNDLQKTDIESISMQENSPSFPKSSREVLTRISGSHISTREMVRLCSGAWWAGVWLKTKRKEKKVSMLVVVSSFRSGFLDAGEKIWKTSRGTS